MLNRRIFPLLMLLSIFLVNISYSFPLPANVVYYMPITVTNYQGNYLPANTPIAIGVYGTTANIIGINALAYSQYYTCNLNNAEFYLSNGLVINSWLEGNTLSELSANSLCTSSSSANALVNSANILYWVEYPWPSTFLPAGTFSSPTSNTIYIGWTGNTLTSANNLINGVQTGEAPQLSCDNGASNTALCGTYAKYDNGYIVFNSFYDNFKGTTLNSALWQTVGASTITVANSLTFNSLGVNGIVSLPRIFEPTGNLGYNDTDMLGYYNSLSLIETPNFGLSPSVNFYNYNSWSMIYITAGSTSKYTLYEGDGQGDLSFQAMTSGSTNSPMVLSVSGCSQGSNCNNGVTYINYGSSASTVFSEDFPFQPANVQIFSQGGAGSILKAYWVRTRRAGAGIPFNAILPASTFGSVFQTPTSPQLTITNTLIDAGQYQSMTANLIYQGTAPYTFNFIVTNLVTSIQTENGLFSSITPSTYTWTYLVTSPDTANSPEKADVVITDSASLNVNSVQYSFTINPVLVAAAPTPTNSIIDSGQYSLLTANPSAGTPAYSYKWYAIAGYGAPGCTPYNAIFGATSATYLASPIVTSSYAYQVTDSASTNSVVCSSGNTIVVNSALKPPTISPSSSQSYSTGQTVTFSALLPPPTNSQPLALDGSVAVGIGYLQNPVTFSFTTSNSQDIIVLDIGFDQGTTTTVNSISDTSGLMWTKRSAIAVPTDGSGFKDDQEVWYAIAPNKLTSDSISVTLSQSVDSGVVVGFAVSGANTIAYSLPWDSNSLLPATANGISTSANIFVSTTLSNDMLLGIIGNNQGGNTGLWVPSGSYKAINSLEYFGNDYTWSSAASYLVFNSPQSANTIAFTNNQYSNYWLMQGDAIQQQQVAPLGTSPYTYNFLIYNSATHILVANMLTSSNTFAYSIPAGEGGNTLVANVFVTDSASVHETVNSILSGTITIPKPLTASSSSLILSSNVLTVGSTITANVIVSGGALSGYSGQFSWQSVNQSYGNAVNVIAGFNGPRFVAINPQGTLAYVASQNGNTVNVINLATNTVVNTITGFSFPRGMAFNPLGTLAYVTNQGPGGNGKTVNVINVATNTVVNTLTGYSDPYSVSFNPSGTFAYVASLSGTINVINVATNTVVNTVITGAQAIAINPQGTLAYISNQNGNTVNVINLALNQTVGSISGFLNPQGIAFNPSGTLAYVASFNGNTVNVINVATNTVVNTLTGFNGPLAVVFNPSGTFAYVTNQNGNTVNVINVAQNQTVSAIYGFSSPRFLAFNPSGTLLYVSSFNGNTVNVISTTQETAVQSLPNIQTSNGLLQLSIYAQSANTLIFTFNGIQYTQTLSGTSTTYGSLSLYGFAQDNGTNLYSYGSNTILVSNIITVAPSGPTTTTTTSVNPGSYSGSGGSGAHGTTPPTTATTTVPTTTSSTTIPSTTTQNTTTIVTTTTVIPITIIPVQLNNTAQTAVVNTNASSTSPAVINFGSSGISVYSNSAGSSSINITVENVSGSLLLPPGSSTISAINISSQQTISKIEMVMHYPCGTPSGNIAPYQNRNGTWSKVQGYTVNSVSCTVSFTAAGAGIVALISGNLQPPLNPYYVYGAALVIIIVIAFLLHHFFRVVPRNKAAQDKNK